MRQDATIGLAAAQDRARQFGCTIAIEDTPRGYVIKINGNAIHSRREDLLTFLTVDGAVNYVIRHFAKPEGLQVRLSVELHV